ncbi:MAG: heparinase II/III domain-containing protein, partial [Puniceicoccales bacterium]
MINILETPDPAEAIRDGLPNTSGADGMHWSDPAWSARLSNPQLLAVRDCALRQAELERESPLPELHANDYAEFGRSGNRSHFEQRYFERRYRWGRSLFAALAAPADERDAWFQVTIEHLRAIASEGSWALPAHTGNPTGQDPRCLDLFSTETAFNLAECLTILGDRVERDEREAIVARIRRDVFQNYRENFESFGWSRGSNNWNAVCHQGILGAAMWLEDDVDLLLCMWSRAAEGLQYFLDGFTEDGGCSEGLAYWSYGFGWFCRLNEQLENYSNGRLSLVEGSEKIRKIAEFGLSMSFIRGEGVRFSDAGGRPDYMIFAYLGQRFRNPDFLALSQSLQQQWVADVKERRMLVYPRNIRFASRFFTHTPPIDAPARVERPAEDAYLPDLGVWVVRGADACGDYWEIAAKGGHNDEAHNHNDVGSFHLNINGLPLLEEIGAPLYDASFFQAETRYRHLAARTLGHSLPVINGHEQSAGRAYCGVIRRATIAQDPAQFAVNLEGAYPASARCESFQRDFRWSPAHAVFELRDRIRLSGPGVVEGAFVTFSGTFEILSSDTALLRNDGLCLRLELEAGSFWDRVEQHSFTDHYRNPRILHRLVSRGKEGA